MLRLRPHLLLAIGLAGLVAIGVAVPAGAAAAARTKLVRYHGYRLVVPASWPVYDLAANPTVCVRFNRHAVYLGQPGSRQNCPAHAVGRTEAILVSPLAAHAARAGGAGSDHALPPAHLAKARGPLTQLAVPSAKVLVTATWGRDPATVARAIGVRRLAPASAAPPTAHPARVRPHATHRQGDVYTGPGFDVCHTPSVSQMSAWTASSPFRAIGFYIGGANEACSQPNLSSTWVGQESGAGWTLLPIYVGLQAPSNSCGCAGINPSQASAEGTAAADDAITQAESLGIGPSNPLYDDMEAYSRTSTNTNAVLAFLSAWTTELHTRGYLSGIYSSANSGITDLVNQVGAGYTEPDQLWIAEWNNQATTSSGYVPAGDWANHQRLHQYTGGHNATYGGVTLNIDSDYVDVGGAAGVVQFPNGAFVQVAGDTNVYEIAGNAPLFVSNWSNVGGPQPVTTITQQQFNSLNPVPTNGTWFQTNTGAIYLVAGGAPLYVSSTSVFPSSSPPFLVDEWNVDNAGNPLSHLNSTPANGTFLTTTTGQNYRVAGGAPIAVTTWSPFGGVQPSVEIDPWDITDIFSPLAHLTYRPAIGTVVQGLPSGAYWAFGPKNRYLVAPAPGAVRVDDQGLIAFSAIPCRVPYVLHNTLTQVKAALLKADCHLGKVHIRRLTRRRHTLRVIKQIPAPHVRKGAYYTVGITLG